MNRRDFLKLSAGAALGQTKKKKPNFLVILADDMGFSDAGCYGGEIDTPNLDKLAARGLRFTQGYSTARCGPSRSCILTGNYAQQTACDVMTPGNTPAWTRFAPQHLKPLGYRAYHSGKWHIKFKPLETAGFDHSYTLLDQDRFFSPRRHMLDDQFLPAVKPDEGYYATVKIADHAVKWLDGHQREHNDDPFYFYLAFTSPHFPLHALKQDIDKYKDKFAEGWDQAREKKYSKMRKMGLVNCPMAAMEPGIWPDWNRSTEELLKMIGPGEVSRAVPWSTLTKEQKDFQRTKMAIHAAMIDRMDQEIGRVLDKLKAMGELDNTVITFISDNGASAEQMIRADGHDPKAEPGSWASHLCLGPGWSTASNTPFRLHKSWVHEGGISSPWIVSWPEGIRDAGKLRHTPCHFVDIVPTMIDIAGGKPLEREGASPLAGKSIAPAYAKDVTVEREFLYFNHNKNRALRVGDQKIVAIGEKGAWEMYNLKTDRSEQKNLAAAEVARVEQMAALWKKTDDAYVQTREAARALNAPLVRAGGG